MQDSMLLLVLPPLLLVPAMGLLSMIRSTHALGRELKRKSLHVGIGLAALVLPQLLTEPWMVVSGLALALAWMSAVRTLPRLRLHFGSVLHDCDRRSLGELYFALAIAALLLATQGSPLLYAIPLLILTLADTAAAIAGRLLPSGQLTGFLRGKTVAGCTAFFAVAAAVCLAMLSNFTQLPAWQVAVAALLVATATGLAEAVCRRGLDNIVVPLVAWFCLRMLDLAAQPASVLVMDVRQVLQPLIGGAM